MLRHWWRVLWFARAMVRKLDANRHKGDWRFGAVGGLDHSYEALFDRLRQEVVELDEAMTTGRRLDRRAVVDAAADVANFAMMIADRVRTAPNARRR